MNNKIMKKYENPMLQIVSINKNDIIATSRTLGLSKGDYDGAVYATDRFRDDYDAGY